MKNYYYVICGIGHLSHKYASKEKAREDAEIFYYSGEEYEIVEGEEAFRAAKIRECEKHGKAWESDINDIKNDKKWNRFIKNFTLKA